VIYPQHQLDEQANKLHTSEESGLDGLGWRPVGIGIIVVAVITNLLSLISGRNFAERKRVEFSR